MKYLKSTSTQTYTILGKVIPAHTQEPLEVSDAVYNKIANTKVIASLIRTGGIMVLNSYHKVSNDTTETTIKLQNLTLENAKMADKIRELEASAKSTKSAKAAEKALAEKEAELAALQEKYAALEAEATAKIAELTNSEESK